MNYYNEKIYKKFQLIKKGVLDENSNKISNNPNNILVDLKEHQKTMIYYMNELEKSIYEKKLIGDNNNSLFYLKTHMGIIADLPGSGKTLSCLGLISYKPFLENTVYPKINSHLFEISTLVNNSHHLHTNLIIIQKHLLSKWKKCMNLTDLSYYIISNSNHLKSNIYNYQNHNVLILVSNVYNDFIVKYYDDISKYTFSRIFYDNADFLKIHNRSNLYLNALFHWFISSSAENLIFPLGYYYDKIVRKIGDRTFIGMEKIATTGIKQTGFIRNCFYNLCIENFIYLQNIILKNKETYVKSSIGLPEINKQYVKCYQSKEIISIEFLESIKTNMKKHLQDKNYDSLIAELNCKSFNSKKSLFNYIKTYNKDLQYDYQKKIDFYIQTNLLIKANEYKQKQTNVINRLLEVQKKFDNFDNETCSICYEQNNISKCPIVLTKCCNNLFCLQCISRSICCSSNNDCPYCRTQLKTNSLYVINNIDKSDKLTKISYLQNFLSNIDTKKTYAIYSETTNESIVKLLAEKNISFTKASNKIGIKKYKKSQINVLYITGQKKFNGYNFENTDCLLFFSDMNNKLYEKNIIGHFQCFNRTKQLQIIYLYH